MTRGVKQEELKQRAIELRLKGYSFPAIEEKLNVKRSTLSGWLKNVILPARIKKIIDDRNKDNLISARELARKTNLAIGKAKRDKIRGDVLAAYSKLELKQPAKEALLAMLYLGEGCKRQSLIGLGNSNSKIIGLFVQLLKDVYNISSAEMTCYLYLRADQNPETEKRYWSKVLSIPLERFRKPQLDKRTSGKKTWKDYHGVCAVYCYNANLEKRLTSWQEVLLDKLGVRSSVG